LFLGSAARHTRHPSAGRIAIVPIFNLPDISALCLTQAALARIFMGNITHWDDPDIAAANPSSTLPDEHITVVVRSDSSGTIHIYTAALASFYQPFNTTVGSAEVVHWPIAAAYLLQESGNLGAVNGVESALYSIGYSVLNDAIN
jgi:phosphate transport system substrate-binding protein